MAKLTVAGRKPRLGMGTVALVASVLMVVGAGLVMWGKPPSTYAAGDGLLRGYQHEPSVAWTLDDTNLAGYSGIGEIGVTGQLGDEWLVKYQSDSGYGQAVMLVDGKSGRQQWDVPVRVGLGDCAITAIHQIGCAVKLANAQDGFYLVDRESGALTAAGPLDDTVRVSAVRSNFLRVNQVGYQVSLRTPQGRTLWSRVFAAAAVPTYRYGALAVETADGSAFLLDPADGSEVVSCTDCRIRLYPTGAVVQRTALDDEWVSFHPRTATGIAGKPARTAERLQVLEGPSTLPVLVGVGSATILQVAGHYEIADPATGEALWQISDNNLSKSNPRPCGDTISLARKDRSRVFFTLADGTRRGEMAPPAVDEPELNLDILDCVGSAGDTVVFGSRSQLTAYDSLSGELAWTYAIGGVAQVIDGYIVLPQGTSLTVLRP